MVVVVVVGQTKPPFSPFAIVVGNFHFFGAPTTQSQFERDDDGGEVVVETLTCKEKLTFENEVVFICIWHHLYDKAGNCNFFCTRVNLRPRCHMSHPAASNAKAANRVAIFIGHVIISLVQGGHLSHIYYVYAELNRYVRISSYRIVIKKTRPASLHGVYFIFDNHLNSVH